MQLYKSLYAITEWKPETERLSFVSDLRDLGVRDAYRAAETHRGAQCPIFFRFGPELMDHRSGKKEQAGWVL